MTFQLLSKDGSSLDDAEVLSGRWQAYVEGFVSDAETSGVPPTKVRRPFLRRSVHSFFPFLPPAQLHHCIRSLPAKAVAGAGHDFYARGGLEIKVCVRTYRLFYVSRTEDVLWRIPSVAEQERANARLVARNADRVRWLDKFTFKGGGAPMSETAAVVE
jgi:paired amphipathic helix protein Sin3a